MASINAAATGNWSSSATWPGGVFPQPGDIVHANGKTITIDQDVTVASINNTLLAGGVVGGTFILASGWTLNANVNAGTGTCLTCSAALGVFVVNGNLRGSNSATGAAVVHSSTGTLTITGSVTGGTGNGASYGLNCSSTSTTHVFGNVLPGAAEGITMSGTANVNITGNVAGGAGAGHGIASGSGGGLTVTGDVTGGTATSHGILMSSGAGPVTINGNVYGAGSGTGVCGGLTIDRVTTATINGNVTGGSAANKHGIYFSGSAGTVCTVNGNVAGGGAAPGTYHSTSGGATFLIVNGSITATTGANGVHSVNMEHTLRARGPFVSASGSGGRLPFDISLFQLIRTTDTDNNLTVRDHTNSTSIVFHTPDFATNLPADADVRDGVSFGGTHTGSLKVPNPNQVSAGIPVDATVGTAALLPEDVWDYLRSAATAPGSMGERLKDAATVATTGDQIATLT